MGPAVLKVALTLGLTALGLALAALAAPNIAAAQPGSPAAEPGSPAAEPRVASIEVRSDAPLARLGNLADLPAFAVGEPLTDEAVRRTLRNAHATGLVAEAAVYSRPGGPEDGGGVVAVLVLWATTLVSEVVLTGDLGLPEEALREALEQEAGEPLVEDRLLRGVYALQDLYEQKGFPAAAVRLRVERGPSEHRVRAVYAVASGLRVTVRTVRLDGRPPDIGQEELRERTGVAEGAPFDQRGAREAAERLRRWLIARDYRLAQVELEEPALDVGAREVDLTYRVEAGPRFEVTVEGASRDALERKKLLPFLSEDGYDPGLLAQTRELVERHFQQKGHYRARVEVSEEALTEPSGEPVVAVAVRVEPGDEYTLEEVRFEGNARIPEAQLADLMVTTPRMRLRPGTGRLVTAILEEDLENMRSFYVLQGFWDARVGPESLLVDGRGLYLRIPIEEGPQRRLGALTFEGAESLPAEELTRGLPLEGSGPFHPRRLQKAVDLVRSRYLARGFESVQVAAREVWIDALLVDVVLRVAEGPRTRIDRIVIRGNHRTLTPVIERFVALVPGEPVSREQLLEVERRLARLGIFSKVDVRMAPGEPGSRDRDIVVRVEEADARRVSYGVGWDSEDGLRGLLGFAHANLGGRAMTLQLNLRGSARDQRYRLLLDQPSLGRFDVPVTYSLFRFAEDRESFEQDSWGVRAEAVHERGEGRRLGLVFDYRIINLDGVEIPLNQIEREDQEIQITSLIPNLVVDRRDDPFDPTRGWFSAYQLQYAFPALSTDAEFAKIFMQQTGYLDLGGAGVVAASLRAGAIEPLGSASAGLDPGDPLGSGNPVPIGERFFLGGQTTHRAYDRDELGILGETLIPDAASGRLIPVGGNGLLLANLEYRFPLIGRLGGTLFADAGNVWPDWRDVDPAEVKLGVGLGLRYRSPIGPVRLELGWKLDREEGEGSTQLFLGIGNPF